jgi:hypothetical protein
MLAPHIDLLFDRHLISFADNGRLILSKKLDAAVLREWHIANSTTLSPFNARQIAYLSVHREHIA